MIDSRHKKWKREAERRAESRGTETQAARAALANPRTPPAFEHSKLRPILTFYSRFLSLKSL